MIEWYIDAIIAYIAIHSNFRSSNEILNEDIKDISINSKDVISDKAIINLNNSLKASYLNFSQKKFNNLFDINKVNFNKIPKNIDVFTYSFPCQDLSSQGLQKGINKELKTQSSLLWQVERILFELKENFKQEELPKYLLMENVKNIVSKKHVENYNFWLQQLNKIGYESCTYILNSQNHGSAQNRERVFCLSIRKDFKEKINFSFAYPKKYVKNKKLKNILDNNQSNIDYLDLSKYKLSDYTKTKNNVVKRKILNYTKFNSENYVYNSNGIGPTLTASGANSRIKIEIENNLFRYMTPKECFKYMGFTSSDYEKVKNTNLLSDTKIIFIAGNSISIEVLEWIFSTLRFEVANGKI